MLRAVLPRMRPKAKKRRQRHTVLMSCILAWEEKPKLILDGAHLQVKEEWLYIFEQWFDTQVLLKPSPGGELPQSPVEAFASFHAFYESERTQAPGSGDEKRTA